VGPADGSLALQGIQVPPDRHIGDVKHSGNLFHRKLRFLVEQIDNIPYPLFSFVRHLIHKNRLTNKQKSSLIVQYMCFITKNEQSVNLSAKKSTSRALTPPDMKDHDDNENMFIIRGTFGSLMGSKGANPLAE
jgi:hypothetical protein